MRKKFGDIAKAAQEHGITVQSEWSRERKKQGLCITCGKRQSENGTRCKKCKENKNAERMKLRNDRVKKGLCSECGEKRGRLSERLCDKCFEKKTKK